MRVEFQSWRPDGLIQAYLFFIKIRNSKEIYLDYVSEKYGFKEKMEGKLSVDDERLKQLPEKIQYTDSKHELLLCQKNWKIEFSLTIEWEPDLDEFPGAASLTFDTSLRTEVHDHFKEFEPKPID